MNPRRDVLALVKQGADPVPPNPHVLHRNAADCPAHL